MRDDGWLTRLETDPEWADLDRREAAMLRYVAKLTRAPCSMQRADVEALRAVGFEDDDVLAICEVAAYYAYANRIADGLGISLEAGVEPGNAEGAER